MEPNKMKTGLVLGHYWRMLKGFRFPFLVIWFLIALATALWLAIPWVYREIFNTLADPLGREHYGYLMQLIAVMALLHFVTWFIWRLTGYGSARVIPNAEKRLRERCFDYLIRHSYRFFSNKFSGSLVRQTNRFVDAFGRLTDKIQWQMIPLVVTLVGITIILFFRDYRLGLLLTGWIVLFLLINLGLSLWKLKYDMRRSALDSKVTGALSDTVTNATNVKLFSAYQYEHDRYISVVEQHRKLWRFTWTLSETITAVQTLLMSAIEILIMYFGIRLWREGILTVGDFALLQGYLISLFEKLWDFGRSIREMYEQIADATEMAEVLALPAEVQDRKRAKPLQVKRGRITFENVGFYYHKRRRVLDGFSLKMKPGEKVALVGPSGAGKSTVIKLLLRLYDLDRGTILIDDQDISRVTQESLWEQVALVPQEPILFHRTLRENIAYGRRNATEEEIIQAAKEAHCHEFIIDLPEGYDTYVGERGVKLSGGERQRVAIARAILKNAPILILDEATSSLDSESESLIQDALARLMKGKTTVVIAHRLSTIMKMDRIVVVEGGCVSASGTHKELLKQQGTYQKLWNIQAGGFV